MPYTPEITKDNLLAPPLASANSARHSACQACEDLQAIVAAGTDKFPARDTGEE
jgi:hypothetical protein